MDPDQSPQQCYKVVALVPSYQHKHLARGVGPGPARADTGQAAQGGSAGLALAFGVTLPELQTRDPRSCEGGGTGV